MSGFDWPLLSRYQPLFVCFTFSSVLRFAKPHGQAAVGTPELVRCTWLNTFRLVLLSLFLSHLLSASPPQALGAGSSRQPSPLLLGDLCLHRGGGEAAGSGADPESREAAGSHPGNAMTEIAACMNIIFSTEMPPVPPPLYVCHTRFLLWLSGCFYVNISFSLCSASRFLLTLKWRCVVGLHYIPKAKSLLCLQIEERAIQDLLCLYEARDNPDELIVVERSSRGPMAAPTWNKHWCSGAQSCHRSENLLLSVLCWVSSKSKLVCVVHN